MTFEDRTITVTDALGTFQAVVTGEALHVLWGAHVGPQEEDGLIEVNRTILERVASWKREADEGEPDGSVRITSLDLEDGDDGFEDLGRRSGEPDWVTAAGFQTTSYPNAPGLAIRRGACER